MKNFIWAHIVFQDTLIYGSTKWSDESLAPCNLRRNFKCRVWLHWRETCQKCIHFQTYLWHRMYSFPFEDNRTLSRSYVSHNFHRLFSWIIHLMFLLSLWLLMYLLALKHLGSSCYAIWYQFNSHLQMLYWSCYFQQDSSWLNLILRLERYLSSWWPCWEQVSIYSWCS